MSKFKIGDRVQFKPNTSKSGRYGEYLGRIYTVMAGSPYNSTTCTIHDERAGNVINYVGTSVLQHVSTKPELSTKEGFVSAIKSTEAKIAELTSSIRVIRQKLDFMEQHGLEEYDENVFKAYEIMRLSKDENLTEIARAKMIAELVKGK
jgi:hypothetical protein